MEKELVQFINSQTLHSGRDDKRVWREAEDGVFTVKFAYLTLQNSIEGENRNTLDSFGVSILYQEQFI